jgi:hypothetical protein
VHAHRFNIECLSVGSVGFACARVRRVWLFLLLVLVRKLRRKMTLVVWFCHGNRMCGDWGPCILLLVAFRKLSVFVLT